METGMAKAVKGWAVKRADGTTQHAARQPRAAPQLHGQYRRQRFHSTTHGNLEQHFFFFPINDEVYLNKPELSCIEKQGYIAQKYAKHKWHLKIQCHTNTGHGCSDYTLSR